jgi:radical SAM enzyme (TIGR01210 family)
MCSYSLDSVEKEFMREFKELMKKEFEKIKIFTSGSFLDTEELSLSVRNQVLDVVKEKGVKEVTIETRPEYADQAVHVKTYLNDILLEVAIGLESATDRVLTYCINKGFTYSDFTKAVDMLDGIRVKAYLLIKPPFLTEYEAVEDAVHSAEAIEDRVDVISFNPVAVHKETVVEYLWRTGGYTPAWIWSVVDVLNRTYRLKPHIICHPVALGKYRGIKNKGCKKCTRELAQKIKEYSLKNEKITCECECKEEWRKEMETI